MQTQHQSVLLESFIFVIAPELRWNFILSSKKATFSVKNEATEWNPFCFLLHRNRNKINFEFGFKESNLMRKSFHGGAWIGAFKVLALVAFFQVLQTHKRQF